MGKGTLFRISYFPKNDTSLAGTPCKHREAIDEKALCTGPQREVVQKISNHGMNADPKLVLIFILTQPH